MVERTSGDYNASLDEAMRKARRAVKVRLLRADIRRLENRVNYELSVLDRRRKELDHLLAEV